jgi:lipopolysaccharide export system protein LptA
MLYSEEESTYILAGDAEYRDKDAFAKADTIIRDDKNKITTLKGNAVYKSEKQTAQGELLIYNDETESFISVGRSKIVDGAMTIISDNTNYSGQTGKGYAKGNVEFIDTSSNMILHAAYLDFDNDNDYMLTFGDSTIRVELIFYSETDSTYMSADTLEVNRFIIENDTIKYTRAWNNVRIYNKSYQAKADSMMQFHSDSLFVLYNDPILWSDDTQISGDTISLWIKEEGLEKMFARQNGFISSFVQLELFNQIKGNLITAFFEDDSLRHMNVNGNAESIYHLEDSEKYLTGTVKTVCSTIDFYFANNSIKDIKFHTDPQSILTPIVKEIISPQRLGGFRWLDDIRPRNKNDIYPRKEVTITPKAAADPDASEPLEEENGDTEPQTGEEDKEQ